MCPVTDKSQTLKKSDINNQTVEHHINAFIILLMENLCKVLMNMLKFDIFFCPYYYAENVEISNA